MLRIADLRRVVTLLRPVLSGTVQDGQTLAFSSATGTFTPQTPGEAPGGSVTLDAIYPVGSVVIRVDALNPGDLWGGTWAAIAAGRVLVGQDTNDTDWDVLKETRGAKTQAAAGEVSQPTFTGSALGTHAHQAGTLVPSAHAGAAVADHGAHTHSVTSNVTVGDHASHTHAATGLTFTGNAVAAASTAATPDLLTSNTAAQGVSPVTTATGSIGGNTAGPSATLSHSVTNNAVTSGNPSATLSHSVTQASAHTMSGSSEAVSAGTPAGTVSQPTFTGSATSIVQPSFVVKIWERTA